METTADSAGTRAAGARKDFGLATGGRALFPTETMTAAAAAVVDSVVGVAAAAAIVVEAGEETAAAVVEGGETAAVEGGGRTVRVTAET